MAILALDLGEKTGWAIQDDTDIIISGTNVFKPGRHQGGGMTFLQFKHWLTEIKGKCGNLEAIYYEEVVARQPAVKSDHNYGGFWAHLTAWCEHHEIPYMGVPVGTIKKFASGKGNCGKDEMIAYAKRIVHNFNGDDNEADAIALLRFACQNYHQSMKVDP